MRSEDPEIAPRALLFRCKESNGSGYNGGTLVELVGYGLSHRGDRGPSSEPESGWWWIWGRAIHVDEQEGHDTDFYYYFREGCLEPVTPAARRVLRELAAANRAMGFEPA